MRTLTISTLQAALVFVLTGCGTGDAPAAYVGGKDAADEKPDIVAAPEIPDTDLPATLDLQEPTPVEEAGTVVQELATVFEESGTVVEESGTVVEESATVDGLIIGDAAPPVSISKWINSNPVEAFSNNKVYVVEFWATWCGPCLASMPHIAGLQMEYGDKVTFIGVSAEEEDVVTEFMGQSSRNGKPWSEVLTYAIALDKDRETNAAYMEAAGQSGIPCAFIVGKSGKVEWIGHPAEIDEPLQEVVDGTWDLQKARNTFLAERESQAIMQEFGPKIQAAFQDGDFKTCVSLSEQLIAKVPGNDEFKGLRFQFLLKAGMFDEANKTAAILIEEAKDEPQSLDQLAWVLATAVPGPGPDLDLALSAAKRAEELTESKNASVLDTLSRVLFLKGNVEEAIAVQKNAVNLADQRNRPQYEETLNEYEHALKGNDTETTPADGDETKPAEGDDAKPAEGDDAKPAEGDDAKPVDPPVVDANG